MTITLYQRVAEDLIQKIRSGFFAVGATLPAEMELVEQYGTSRNTIRAAMKQLEDMALVTRKRNRGTVVIGQPSANAFIQSLTTLDDLVSFASQAARTVVESREEVLDIALARELGCAPGSRWLRIAMLRRPSDASQPLAWTDAFVDAHYEGIQTLAQEHPDRLLCDLMELHYARRVATIEQSVSACHLPQQVAETLAVAPGEPGLKIIRKYRDSAKALVLVTRSYYAGTRYTQVTTLVRGN